jgi:GNAT superfamily N-acetyltransferase
VSTLRQARVEDIAAMHRVRLAVKENRLRRVITENDYVPTLSGAGRGWVVESQGEIVGFAIGDKTSGNVWALFVHPDHEGRGYGRRLFAAMLEWFRAEGVTRLQLTTDPGTRAQKFYETAGWTAAGVNEKGELRFEWSAP